MVKRPAVLMYIYIYRKLITITIFAFSALYCHLNIHPASPSGFVDVLLLTTPKGNPKRTFPGIKVRV